MVTQLQDVANTVAQEKISNQRLRNEEIRRQMANPWTAPQETTSTQGTQPLQDIYSNNGYSPTEASTYSRLKNNVDSLGLSGNYSGSSTSGTSTFSNGKSTGNIPGIAAPIVGTMMGIGGLGRYAGLGYSAVNFARGDTASGLGGLTNWVARQTPLGKITGLPELAGTVASGLTKGKDFGEMAKDAAWTLGKSALTKAVPGLGLADFLMGLGTAGISALTGKDLDWNPRRGLEGLFGNGLDGVAPGFTGTGYGFFGNHARGSGIKSTPANISNSGFTGSGSSSGYTPPGFSSGDLGSGITNSSSGYGVSGGLSTPSYSWGSSGYSSNNDSSDSDSSSSSDGGW